MNSLKRIPYFGAIILLTYMPFHIFLSQWLSFYSGGLEAWKVGKDFLTIALVIVSVLSVWIYKKFNNSVFKITFLLTLLYALAHIVVFYFNQDLAPTKVALLAMAYNNRLLWYLLIGQSAVLIWPRVDINKILKITLVVSTIVSVFAVLQFLLPKDLMENFGYSLARGARAAFFIDDKSNLPRVFSTLRDPNSLGAYLILPLTLILQRLLKDKNKMLYGGLFSLHALALFLTFSRSAWLGAFFACGFLMGYLYKEQSLNLLKRYWLLFAFGFLLLASSAYALRDQYFVQNLLFHSDESTVEIGSSEKHLVYAQAGIEGTFDKPLGHGPGTAGIVSIQNPRGGLLTENYYIQIAYEVGLLGLAVFIALNIFIYKKLVQQQSVLAICLLASFWGYVICNMLLHSWSNEAVAAQWWLLAGLALTTKSSESLAVKRGKATNQFA